MILRYGIVVLLTAICTALLVLVTPIRFFDLVSPVVKDVNATAFHAAYSANPDDYVFVDVRSTDEYARAHAVGAINMPLATLFDGYTALPRHGKTIVLICAGGRESGIAYGYLEHLGYFNLRRVSGGTKEWVAENLPTHAGTQP